MNPLQSEMNVLPRDSPGVTEDSHWNLSQDSGYPAEIRIEHLANTSEKGYRVKWFPVSDISLLYSV